MVEVTKEHITQAEENLKIRKNIIDFESLGRTLAYSPYMSRIKRDFFMRKDSLQNIPKTAYRFALESFYQTNSLLDICTQSGQSIDLKYDVYMLDLCAHYIKIQTQDYSMCLEGISILRRYSTLPIIHADIFLDKYQILESALFGADILLMLDLPFSGKTLKELLDFARRLDIDVFVAVRDKDELKKAIFSGADMLFIPHGIFYDLLSFVPNTQIIATNHSDEYGVDLWIRDQ